MTSIARAWLEGAVMGLAVAVPFGPINVEIIRRHLGRGFAAGLLLGLGACSVDTAYILLISFGLITAAPGPRARAWLTVAGAVVLLALAAMIVRSAKSSAQVAVEATRAVGGPDRLWRHYAVGVVMTAASPMNLVFWFGLLASGQYFGETAWGPWPRVAGVMCGTISWVTGFNLALMAGRRVLRPRAILWVNLASAGVLAALAGLAIYRSLGAGQ